MRTTMESLFSNLDDNRREKELSFEFFFDRFELGKEERIRYLDRTTLLPLTRLWRDEEEEARCTSYYDKVLQFPFIFSNPIFGTMFTDEVNYRFCKECIRSDVKTHGVDYWHRSHQVPGVVVCATHHQVLCECVVGKAQVEIGRASAFTLPNDHIDSVNSSSEIWSGRIEENVFSFLRDYSILAKLLLELDAEVACESSAWAVMLEDLSKMDVGSPADFESGKFCETLKQQLEALVIGGSEEAYLCLEFPMYRERLFSPKTSSGPLIIATYVSKSPTDFLNRVLKSDEKIGRLEMSWSEREKVVDCIRHGGTIGDIATILSVPDIQAWILTRSSMLAPNEVLGYLNSSRIQRIRALLLDDVSLRQISESEHLLLEDIVRFIEKNEELKQAFVNAMKRGQMDANKKQLMSVTISEWPCKFRRVRELAEECVVWVEVRDLAWIRRYKEYINLRTQSIDPAFIEQFPLYDSEVSELIEVLGLEKMREDGGVTLK